MAGSPSARFVRGRDNNSFFTFFLILFFPFFFVPETVPNSFFFFGSASGVVKASDPMRAWVCRCAASLEDDNRDERGNPPCVVQPRVPYRREVVRGDDGEGDEKKTPSLFFRRALSHSLTSFFSFRDTFNPSTSKKSGRPSPRVGSEGEALPLYLLVIGKKKKKK